MEGLPPVHIIPHGVDYKLFYPKKVERDERFTFISVKGWAEGIHDRGGLQYLFKAFVEEFKEDEQVKLLVKVNLFYGGSEAHVEAWLKEMGIEKLPSNVEIVYDNLKFNELVDFYNKGDVFVSPTRGEAFGLNYVEAMACGKPVIATNFGGQTDFIDETVGWLIEYKLEEVIHNPAYEGIKWATPDIKHLKETLRYCFEHQKEIKIKGENALKKIVGEYTWKHTAEKAKKALELFGIKD